MPFNNDPIHKKDEIFWHNFMLFLDEDNRVIKTLHENNGWLLLEAIMREKLDGVVPERLKILARSFGNEAGLWGWWPENVMKTGRRYFIPAPHLKTYKSYDVDDTAWGAKLNHRLLTEEIVKNFMYDTDLSGDFQSRCAEIKCQKQFILRLWKDIQNLPPKYNINIVCIANAISVLDLNSGQNRVIFEENKKFINHIVENFDYNEYFEFYAPKITGTFLLLFYDKEYRNFLSNAARDKLMKDLLAHYEELQDAAIEAKWGVSERVLLNVGGYNITAVNAKIPQLMYAYVIKNWLKENAQQPATTAN